MPGTDHSAIHRSLDEMSFHLADLVEKKANEPNAYKLAEVEQQVQVDINAVAHSDMQWVVVPVTFEETFYYAPYQRNNKNEDPQMVYGAVLDKGRAMLSVHVESWTLDQDDNYVGAKVAIGLFDPSDSGSTVQGTVHMTFQGLGAPVEDPGSQEG